MLEALNKLIIKQVFVHRVGYLLRFFFAKFSEAQFFSFHFKTPARYEHFGIVFNIVLVHQVG